MCVYISFTYIHTYVCLHTIREADKSTENGFSESVGNCTLVEIVVKSFGMENIL